MPPQSKIKIYFAALFGVDFDSDLAYPWVNHYKQFDIDTFIIYLHSQNNDRKKLQEFKKFFQSHNYKVYIANDDIKFITNFYNGNLRKQALSIVNKKISENDYLVTADSDEFQQIPGSYRDAINGKDVLCGKLVDRYSDTLKKYDPSLPLDTQYPLSGDVQQKVFDLSDKRYFHLFNWCSNNKIIASRGKMPVAFGGSHCLYPGNDNKYTYSYKDNPLNVHHYRWRENVIERMQQRKYNKAIHLWYFMQFFNVSRPETNFYFQKQLEYEEKIQKKRGWVV